MPSNTCYSSRSFSSLSRFININIDVENDRITYIVRYILRDNHGLHTLSILKYFSLGHELILGYVSFDLM